MGKLLLLSMISSYAITISRSMLMVSLIAATGYYAENAIGQATQLDEIPGNQTKENNTTITTSKLTRQAIDPIVIDLLTAREELNSKNSPSAFDALNAAASKLFNLTANMGANDDGEDIYPQLKLLQKRIEQSRAALLQNNNLTAATTKLNAADSEFIKLTLKLS